MICRALEEAEKTERVRLGAELHPMRAPASSQQDGDIKQTLTIESLTADSELNEPPKEAWVPGANDKPSTGLKTRS